jgi:hypothetical protein
LTFHSKGFADVKDPYAIQKQLVKYAQQRLESKVGKKYRDVVLICLTGDFEVTDDTKEDRLLQQAFRSKVVAVLEAAAHSLN